MLEDHTAQYAVWSPQAVRATLVADSLRPMTPEDFPSARQMAATLIGGDMASPETVRAAAARCGCALLVHTNEDGVDGVLAILPLSPLGLAACEADRFDGAEPAMDFIPRPGEPLAAVYGWGFVGVTRRGMASVVSGMNRLRVETWPNIPFYGRAATDAGRRVIEGRLGYRLQPGTTSGLFVNPPLSETANRSAA